MFCTCWTYKIDEIVLVLVTPQTSVGLQKQGQLMTRRGDIRIQMHMLENSLGARAQ